MSASKKPTSPASAKNFCLIPIKMLSFLKNYILLKDTL